MAVRKSPIDELLVSEEELEDVSDDTALEVLDASDEIDDSEEIDASEELETKELLALLVEGLLEDPPPQAISAFVSATTKVSLNIVMG